MSEGFEGGCACGKVRYKATADPRYMGNCHCRDCQRATGAGFYPGVGVAADAFEIVEGAPQVYSRESDAGRTVHRYFCAECGSPLLIKTEAMPRYVSVYAGSLDDPSIYKPQTDIFTASAQPWTLMHEGTAKSEKMPG
mgnify:CR=1 FL=1